MGHDSKIEQLPRYGTNWEALLKNDEVGTRNDQDNPIRVVLLAGLQRLAQMAGLMESTCEIRTPSDTMVQVIYQAAFSDGTSWVGTGDCSSKNTTGKFLNYPTAVAESRAEARCLKKALGIRMLSSEELDPNVGVLHDVSLSDKADEQLIAAIQSLCETREIEPVEVLEQVISDKERKFNICELSELSTEEAQKALSWLNQQKPKGKKRGRKAKQEAEQ